MEECRHETKEQTWNQQYIAKLGKVKAEHYRQYYQYGLPENQLPGDVVNSLFDRVMRNDKEALEKVLGILADNTYAMLCSRLESAGFWSTDNLDDLIQIIRMEIIQMSFRGFPSKVTKDGFYGYLIRIVQNQAARYRKAQQYERENTVSGDDKENKRDPFEEKAKRKGEAPSPMEERLINKEEEQFRRRVIDYFIAALAETDRKPYQAVTYGYACMLPKIINTTGKRDLLRKVNEISGRESGKQSSGFDEAAHSLWGEITRKSKILMDWTMDAICGKTVQFLSEEFVELYNMDPLNGKPFSWKNPFQQNLGEKEKKKEKIIAELVITEEFEKGAIKNWPPRMEETLIEKTRERMKADQEFMKKSTQIAPFMAER